MNNFAGIAGGRGNANGTPSMVVALDERGDPRVSMPRGRDSGNFAQPMSSTSSPQCERYILENARVVTPERVIDNGVVIIEGDRIVAVREAGDRSSDPKIDVGGRLLMPGLVDIHGDDLERHVFPRPSARMDMDLSLVQCDRANIAAGVTTKFHAIAFEDAPDKDRSVSTAGEMTGAVAAMEGLLADNRIHVRCELGDTEAVDASIEAIGRDEVGLVSLMNHCPEDGQFSDVEQFSRHYGDGGSVNPARAEQLIQQRQQASARELLDRAARVIGAAGSADVPVASHDDQDVHWIDRMNECDVSICEYPVTMTAARRATDLGMATAMGAPNLVRGASLWGNLSALDAIRAGVVDILASDYHPTSLLAAVFARTGEPLVDRVARVTRKPADAVGLRDRGRIEAGARADLLVVDPAAPPRVERAFVAGSEVFRVVP